MKIYYSEIDNIMMSNPDAFMLLVFLRGTHGGQSFALPNDACNLMPGGGWRRQRFTAARTKLIESGALIPVRNSGRGSPMVCKLAVSGG